MKFRTKKTIGFSAVFLPFFVLWMGVALNVVWLNIAFFFLLVPFLRPVFNHIDPTRRVRLYSGLQAAFLSALPRLYVVAWLATLIGVGIWLQTEHTLWQMIGFGFSLWVVTSINVCVAHELIHGNNQSGQLNKFLGRFLSATSGHPTFPFEHPTHHAQPQHNCAAPGTSLYAFALKRGCLAIHTAFEWESSRLVQYKRSWWQSSLCRWLIVTVSLLIGAYIIGGFVALILVLLVGLGTMFTEQTITYLQHWGLAGEHGAWEDGCYIQSSILLNNPYHDLHHERPGLPYFYLAMSRTSYRLPSSYAIMFMMALIPPLFDAQMRQAYERQAGRKHSAKSDTGRCIPSVSN